MMDWEIFGITATGPVRPVNEDHLIIGRFIKNSGQITLRVSALDDYLSTYGLLLAVADGVGGETGGALASRLTLSALDAQFYGVEKGSEPLEHSKVALEAGGERANRTVLAVQANQPQYARMGCTLSGVCLTPEGWLVFNAGDSRVYRLRDGFLFQATRDDSLTAMAVRTGSMSLEASRESASRHTIVNLVGSAAFNLSIEIGHKLKCNDLLLICSDGLHEYVGVSEIETSLSGCLDLRTAATRLVDKAIANGSRDNVSLILARLFASGDNPADPHYCRTTTEREEASEKPQNQ